MRFYLYIEAVFPLKASITNCLAPAAPDKANMRPGRSGPWKKCRGACRSRSVSTHELFDIACASVLGLQGLNALNYSVLSDSGSGAIDLDGNDPSVAVNRRPARRMPGEDTAERDACHRAEKRREGADSTLGPRPLPKWCTSLRYNPAN